MEKDPKQLSNEETPENAAERRERERRSASRRAHRRVRVVPQPAERREGERRDSPP